MKTLQKNFVMMKQNILACIYSMKQNFIKKVYFTMNQSILKNR